MDPLGTVWKDVKLQIPLFRIVGTGSSVSYLLLTLLLACNWQRTCNMVARTTMKNRVMANVSSVNIYIFISI